jgi:hypothetical protein
MVDIENGDTSVNDTIDAVSKAAVEATAAGLCILPPSENGEKRPWPNDRGFWDPFKRERPAPQLLSEWYPNRSGIGVITGAVSGRVEAWDFDERDTYDAFVAAARVCGLGEVIDRIEAGYCDNTAGDGVRWLVRYPAEVERAAGGRAVLARRPKRDDEKKHPKDKIKTLIELPGYAILAPSNGNVHPSRKPYVRRSGGFASIASYTAEEREALIELARTFDAMPRSQAGRASKSRAGGDRPGDDFNARATWAEVLSGWTLVYERAGVSYWRRPGKSVGISATTNYKDSDLLYVFTTSSEFDADKAYDRFAAYAVLNHGGDFGAAAKALAAKGFGDPRRSRAQSNAASAVVKQVGEYRATEEGIQWCRQTKDGAVWTSLTNFTAAIASDITQDDGIETIRALEIEAVLNGRTSRFTVSAAQFGQMTWPLEHLGAEAVVQPGQGAKDRARAAIQVLSGRIPQRRVYTHTGWRQVDGQWIYMHGGGAVGSAGPVGSIEVQLPEQLERYVLPEVDDDDGLRDAVEASLAMRNVAPHRVTDPLLGAIYRAPIGGADFSLHLSGHTGVKKTEVGALAQQHFGAAMDARALPASWSSTGNALEALASAVKDAVLVIDDFVPQGTVADRARLNALADRVLRAQGNRSGRGRLRSDATMRRVRPPRGLIISTGEEVPGGQSLRARLVIIEVQRDDVNTELLTLAQHAAAQGTYALAMAGYVRWLAPRLDQTRDEFISLTRERRTSISISHARTADAFAQLSAAWSIWLGFANDVGAVTRAEAYAIEREVWASLTQLADEQQGLQLAYDPVERFRSLLGAVLSSGKGHIASAANIDRPPPNTEDAKGLGWRRRDDGSWHPLGPCVGWWAEDGIYLEPDATYAATQQLGGASGEGIGVASTTLWRRMYERRLLLSTERAGGELRLKARKAIGGRRRRIVHIAHLDTPHAAETGPSGPGDPADANDEASQEVA